MNSFFLLLRQTFTRLFALGPAGLLAAFWLTVPGVAGLVLLYELGPVSAWLRAQGTPGLFVFALVLMITSGLGLLPTTAQAVLGGWVFGVFRGSLAASVAFAGAALIGLAITRLIAGRRFENWIDAKPEAWAVRHALVGRGFVSATLMVALLRVPPQAPFAFMNLLLVSSGVPAGPFVLGTVLGMLPRTMMVMLFAGTAAASGAADIQTFISEGPGWPVAVAGFAALLVVMAIIGAVARRALAQLQVDPILFSGNKKPPVKR